MRIRIAGVDVDLRFLCRRVDNSMPDEDSPRSDTDVVQLRPRTIDDGVIRLGPVRVEPLTASQEVQVVELFTALFAAAAQRKGSKSLRRAA